MKTNHLSTWVAIIAILVGVGLIVFGLLYPLVLSLLHSPDILDILAILLMLSLFTAVPGVFLLYNGISLLKRKENRYIKGTVGTFVVIVAFMVEFFVFASFKEIFLGTRISIFVTTLIAIPLYVALSKFFIKREGLTWRKGEFIDWGIILLLAWELFFVGMDVTDTLFPVGSTSDVDQLFTRIGFLLSIVLPIFFYWIATRRIILRHKEYLKKENIDNAVLLNEGLQPHEEN